MVQLGLTRAREQKHSFTSSGMAPLCFGLHQHRRQLSLVRHQRVLLPRSQCPLARQLVLRLRLHRLPTLPPRWWLWPQLFDTAVHGVDELAETLSPFSASGRPPNTTCTDTWPWEQKTCRLCTAPLETGILLQSSTPLRSSTNEERGERGFNDQRIPCRKHLQ